MGLTTNNTGAISFKKLSGKAHTQQNFAVSEESIATNVQMSYSTVFGQPIVGLPITTSGLTAVYATNGIVQRVMFQIDIIPNTQIGVNQSQGYRLKLPADWNTHPGALYPKFTTGTYLHTALGKLQIVPALYGTLKTDGTTEYDPILYQTNGSTVIAKFDPINWYFDPYDGVIFVEDPPAGFDVNAARPGFLEAYLYVGKYLDQIVTGITSGGTTPTGSTNVTANNGLTKTGNNIRLGGALTGNTSIDLNNKIFNYSDSAFSGYSVNIGNNALIFDAKVSPISNHVELQHDYTLIQSQNTGTSTSFIFVAFPGQFGISSSTGVGENASINNTSGTISLSSQKNDESGAVSLNAIANIFGESTSIQVGTAPHSMFISDQRTGTTQTGIEYLSDYSLNYTARSLVDAGYVTGHTSPITKINGTSIASTGIGAGVGTTGVDGVFLGVNAGNGVSQQKQVAIGYFAGNGATGAYNANFIGVNAGNAATAADKSNFIGHHAGENAAGALRSNFIGRYAGANAANSPYSNFLGAQAGWNAINASNSIFIGTDAGNGAANAAQSIFIGLEAGNADIVNTTGSFTDSAILIGYNTKTNGNINSIAIGSLAQNTMQDQFVIAPSYINWQIRGLDYVMPSIQAVGQLTNDGSGNLVWSATTGGGGGTLTGATNGLSVSGKNVVLGGALTGNTTIAMSTYKLVMTGGTWNFTVDPVNNKLIAGSNCISTGGTINYTFGDTNINNGFFGSVTFGELSEITSNVGDGMVCGEGSFVDSYGGKSFARGGAVRAGGDYSLIGGGWIPGFAYGKTNPKAPQTSAFATFGWYSSDGSQVDGHGVNGAYSAIIGGINHNIPSTTTSSVILGGNTIKADSGVTNTVFLPKVRFGLGTGAGIVTNNSNNDILVRNSATGEIEIRDAVTLISGMTSGGSQNIYITKRIITGSTTLLTTDFVIFVNGSTPLILTLPFAPNDGEVLKIKDVSGAASINNITINGNGHTIDGSSTILINTDRGGVELCFDTTLNAWFVMNFVG